MLHLQPVSCGRAKSRSSSTWDQWLRYCLPAIDYSSKREYIVCFYPVHSTSRSDIWRLFDCFPSRFLASAERQIASRYNFTHFYSRRTWLMSKTRSGYWSFSTVISWFFPLLGRTTKPYNQTTANGIWTKSAWSYSKICLFLQNAEKNCAITAPHQSCPAKLAEALACRWRVVITLERPLFSRI